MKDREQWLKWAMELQSLSQAGLNYAKDVFDVERYTRIREISAEIMAHKGDIPVEKVKNLFCNEIGYQTPKIDCRAAVFKEDRVLMVKERDGKWSLPGGWVDVDQSVADNTVKEVLEGNLREIIGQMNLKDMVQNRKEFNVKVQENVSPDLREMGLVVVSFAVQSFMDEKGVIDNLGIENISKISKDASIAKAQA